MQEIRTNDHIICIKKYFNKDLSFNKNQGEYLNHNCSKDSLDNLFQELYKRFIVPLYIPILILNSLFLIIYPKENKLFQRSRLLIFLNGIFIIILSETIMRFVVGNFLANLKIIFAPFIIFLAFYIVIRILINKNIGSKVT